MSDILARLGVCSTAFRGSSRAFAGRPNTRRPGKREHKGAWEASLRASVASSTPVIALSILRAISRTPEFPMERCGGAAFGYGDVRLHFPALGDAGFRTFLN